MTDNKSQVTKVIRMFLVIILVLAGGYFIAQHKDVFEFILKYIFHACGIVFVLAMLFSFLERVKRWQYAIGNKLFGKKKEGEE